MADFLEKNNAVAIHARRGDMMSNVWWCYKYGYFKRAVKYIRKHVADPVFVFSRIPEVWSGARITVTFLGWISIEIKFVL